MKPSSAGFALQNAALLAATALVLHEYQLTGDAARMLTRAIGVPALLFTPFFPLFVALSPSPANGSKLLIFSASASVTASLWLGMTSGAHWTQWISWGLTAAVAGNVAALAYSSAEGALRDKPIAWRHGGKPWFAVLVLSALAAAAVWYFRVPTADDPQSAVGVILFGAYAYFFATRHSVSPGRQFGAVFWACAAVFASGLLTGESRFARDIPVAAFSLGALYAFSHLLGKLERTPSFIAWLLVAVICSLGAVAPYPAVALPLAVAAAAFLAQSELGRARIAFAGAVLLAAIIGGAVAAGALRGSTAFDALRDHRSRCAFWPLEHSVAGAGIAAYAAAVFINVNVRSVRNATAPILLFGIAAAALSAAGAPMGILDGPCAAFAAVSFAAFDPILRMQSSP